MAPDLFDPPEPEAVALWNLFQVARWMGVAPWALVAQPAFWYEWGSVCMAADNALEKETRRQVELNYRMGGAG